jgi:hypothetical protein
MEQKNAEGAESVAAKLDDPKGEATFCVQLFRKSGWEYRARLRFVDFRADAAEEIVQTFAQHDGAACQNQGYQYGQQSVLQGRGAVFLFHEFDQ